MRQRFLTTALRWLGPSYPIALLAVQPLAAPLICAGAVGLATFYIDFKGEQFFHFLIFAEVVTLLSVLFGLKRSFKVMKPVRRWLAGNRSDTDTVQAWQSAVSLPIRYLGQAFLLQFVLIGLPVALYGYFVLDFNIFGSAIVYIGAMIAVGYSFMLSYFAQELGMRPVVVQLARALPDEVRTVPRVVSLQWKLLAGIPLITIFSGYVVASLSASGEGGILGLGTNALIAVIVASFISLELSFLLSRSILVPVNELIRATNRVTSGDIDVRVPITSNDELGALARSFNQMIEGVVEREKLREAFDTYVEPGAAERVLEEGESLAGEEVVATVMFADIRGFTAIASRSTPAQAVDLLNNFYECVVPILEEYGGHANKFVGDGIMAVFGVPERYPNHADRALEAASAIAEAVERRFDGGIKVGLGLNSGPVVAGSIGGGGRLEFTVIGDVVNVASRTEQLTRDTGDTILITGATYDYLSERDGLKPREPVVMKGKEEPIEIYAGPLIESQQERPAVDI